MTVPVTKEIEIIHAGAMGGKKTQPLPMTLFVY
jgi:hypothetical protein